MRFQPALRMHASINLIMSFEYDRFCLNTRSLSYYPKPTRKVTLIPADITIRLFFDSVITITIHAITLIFKKKMLDQANKYHRR